LQRLQNPDALHRAQEPSTRPHVLSSIDVLEDTRMGRGILLWLLGVPIPVIILLWLFFGR
jgi:hypothetical protein